MSYTKKTWVENDYFTPEDATAMSAAIKDNEITINPELDGTEDTAESIQVGNTKYKLGGSGGSSQLQYITVYTEYNDYPVYFTMQVDDNSLETYSDLYNYLVRKGICINETADLIIPAVGYHDSYIVVGVTASVDEGDEYIGVYEATGGIVYIYENTENFSITYLGQE